MVLIPFNRAEAMSLKEAATIAGRTTDTIRLWCANHDIGRLVGGRWLVSRPALLMYLDGDQRALRAYHNGERTSEIVAKYFVRAGLTAA